MAAGTALFLDTSIQIARFVHAPATKRNIDDRIGQYNLTVTSEVVLQEFKRRLLREAQYLLNQFQSHGSYKRVLRHIADVLPPVQARKRNICLDLLVTIEENESERDITDRGISYLRTLIKCGLDDFEESVDSIIRDAGCLCARQPIKQRGRKGEFDFGGISCTKSGGSCGIGAFLQSRLDLAEKLLDYFKRLPANEKTAELLRSESFLDLHIDDLSKATDGDPCLKVGDLVIALESADVPLFYTINARESLHFCKVVGQTLIVRPINPAHNDMVYTLEPTIDATTQDS